MKFNGLWCLCLFSLVLAACQPAPTPESIPNSPQVWIDAPLADASLPLAPYLITSHAASPQGLASFELSVNGQVLRTDPVDPAQANQTLTYIKQAWTPPAPGTYLLGVRAADSAGNFSPAVEIRVKVVAVPSETPTPEATATATRTVTPSPTATPTASPTRPRPTRAPPTATPPPLPTETRPPAGDTTGPTFDRISPSTSTFRDGRCTPNSVTVTAVINDPATAVNIRLWYRVGGGRYASSGMDYLGGSNYRITVTAAQLPAGVYGVFEFYITAQDGFGNPSQSPVNSSVSFNRC
jgi:hypothetical protein